MDSLRIGLSVARNNMRKYLFSWRSLMIALVALMLIYARSSEVRQLCDIYGALASPLPLFVSFTNSLYPGTVLLVCWVLLVCDAPFIDESQPMLLLRAGRARWSLGQVAFLWGYALVYWLYVMLLCVLVLLPHVEWSTGWSDVYRSLEITGESGNLKFYGSVMSEYSALSAHLCHQFCHRKELWCGTTRVVHHVGVFFSELVCGQPVFVHFPRIAGTAAQAPARQWPQLALRDGNAVGVGAGHSRGGRGNCAA